ncbi:hypothetical protein CIB95_05495 [Lottiidibacillus patelloidae]|uniref:Myb-like domain-containing protein n=1 Tax=Lottiidibacillus patelloidae TaxID=2670334 RepID=A0A263BXA9_9BACI|nr:RsfA family transcriptional regulator [Lottiidibacillus patelloidae]OZM57816.1 hypothetical protein CIB95_05495 [Lottiidibacillus patelloidae]
MKVRQDAWSHEDDLLLAETVLRHIRDGGTQLQAFEEVGDHLNRTSAACGFRWNAVVRRKYEQAISLAKKQRKERKRALAKQQAAANDRKTYQNPQSFSAFEFGEEYIPLSERKSHTSEHKEEQQSTVVNQTSNEKQEREMSAYGSNRTVQTAANMNGSTTANEMSLKDVIAFLQNLNYSNSSSQKLQLENERLKQDLQSLLDENENLKRKVKRLEQDQETIQEDYQSLIKIMDRARRMVVFSDDENVSSTSFKMDKNGNLEKIAK